MNVGIIIITHGKLAEAFRDTLFSIVGQKDKVFSIPITTDFTLETLCEKIQSIIEYEHLSNVVIFTDMLGGTPCNASLMVCKNSHKDNIYIISSVNLYMLITAVSLREQYEEMDINEYISKIIESGRNCIVNINELFKKKLQK